MLDLSWICCALNVNRHFTDGAVIGSKAFVNEVFVAARERFTAKRKDGARRLRGNGKAAAGIPWSVRDLRVRVGTVT